MAARNYNIFSHQVDKSDFNYEKLLTESVEVPVTLQYIIRATNMKFKKVFSRKWML